MGSTSETRTYDALLSTTLENWAKGLEDEITSSNAFFYMLKRSRSWIGLDALGERAKFSLRYKNTPADSFAGYDIIDTTPQDGITAAFFPWRQLATSLSINGLEEAQNSGEYRILDLLEEKANQSKDGIIEHFNKAILQGNGINTAAAITTAYTSPTNNSVFVDPLPLLVGTSPTAGTIGSIAANISDGGVNWWANQRAADTGTNFASFLKDLDHMRNLCSKGVGGFHDLNITDQNTYELYMAALRSQNRFTDYTRADIPFDNVAFHRQPVVWDEFVPDTAGATTTQSATSGTWWMLNSKNIQCKYHNKTNFTTTPFIRPENQDAKTATILWYGALGVNARRKHGLLDAIDTTLAT